MFFQKQSTHLKALPDFSAFQFTSKGMTGTTTRQIRFVSQKGAATYNLDIGDLHAENERVSSITDDGDMYHVMTILMQVIELYTERYPNRVIRLKGNTKEKARLYRVALDLYLDILFPHFDIGLEEEKQFFSLRKGIDNIAFLLKRKPGWCFSVHTVQTTLSSKSLLFGNLVTVELRRNTEVGVVSAGNGN